MKQDTLPSAFIQACCHVEVPICIKQRFSTDVAYFRPQMSRRTSRTAFLSRRNIFFLTLSIFLYSGSDINATTRIKREEKIDMAIASQDLNEVLGNKKNLVLHENDSSGNPLQASTTENGYYLIGLPADPAFEGFVKCGEHGVEPTGYCIDIFKAAIEMLGYNLSLYKFQCHKGKYDELVHLVNSTRFAAAVGDLTILASRSELVVFTMPYAESSLTMVVRKKVEEEAWLFVKPFTSTVWLSIFSVFVLTMLVVWFMEHRSNPDFNGPWISQLSTATWFTFSTLFFAHRERIQSNYTRAVMLIWFCAVYVIITSYQASLTSMLTVPHLIPAVTDYKELQRNGDLIGCDEDSFVGTYLQDVLKFHPDKIVNITSEHGFLKEFENGNKSIKAAFLEAPYARIFLSKNPKDYKDSGQKHRFGGFGFAFPLGSPLAAEFSKAFLKLSENGTLNDLDKKWFPTNSLDSGSSSKIEEQRLSLGYLKGLFIVTGISPMVILVLYIIFGRRRNPPLDPANTGDDREASNEPHSSPQRNVSRLSAESLNDLHTPGQRQQSQVEEIQMQNIHLEVPDNQTRPLRQPMSFPGPDRHASGVNSVVYPR